MEMDDTELEESLAKLEVPELGALDEQKDEEAAGQATPPNMLASVSGPSDVLPTPLHSVQAFSELDSAVDQAIYDRALWDARQSLRQDAELKLPWESGVFGEIFGDGSISIPGPTDAVPPCVIPACAAELVSIVEPSTQAVNKRHLDVPLHALVSANRRDLDAVQLEAEAWETAISKWQFLYSAVDFSGTIGSRIFKAKMSGASEDDCRQIIRDVLGIKSPKTAIKRADCFRRFINWLVLRSCKPWPFYSGRVLAYLSDETCSNNGTSAHGGV